MTPQPSTTLDAHALDLSTVPFTHERVLITTGVRSGLTMSVAVHSTALGQALGGARVWQYDNWTDAVADSLRLSAAMTLKNAAAGLNRADVQQRKGVYPPPPGASAIRNAGSRASR